MSYSTQAIYGYDVINVYSSDGVEWDTLDGPPLKFGALMEVDTRWPGYIGSMGVLNGYCVDGGCASNPVIHADPSVMERDIHQSRTFEIAMEDVPISNAGGIATIALGDQVLDICNDHLTANGATSLYAFSHDVTTSFSVNTGKSVRLNPPEVVDPTAERVPTTSRPVDRRSASPDRAAAAGSSRPGMSDLPNGHSVAGHLH
jgi:hypothetical protein